MAQTDTMKQLEQFGFSQIEALVYLCLLGKAPQTGYKIAAAIGKSRSNTYQALSSLEAKKALIRLEGTQHGEFIPVPIDEFLDAEEREFASRKKSLVASLKEFSAPVKGEYIHQITGTSQLYDKVRSMLLEARAVVLVDTDKDPLEKIHGLLEELSSAGIEVVVESPVKPDKSAYGHIRLKPLTAKDTDWEADWLCLSVDGSQFLISLVDKKSGELIHGLWSGDAYISPWVFNGMLHEMAFRYVMMQLETGKDRDSILKNIEKFTKRLFKPSEGFVQLQRMLKERNP